LDYKAEIVPPTLQDKCEAIDLVKKTSFGARDDNKNAMWNVNKEANNDD
jgi:hypothetical protein